MAEPETEKKTSSMSLQDCSVLTDSVLTLFFLIATASFLGITTNFELGKFDFILCFRCSLAVYGYYSMVKREFE